MNEIQMQSNIPGVLDPVGKCICVCVQPGITRFCSHAHKRYSIESCPSSHAHEK